MSCKGADAALASARHWRPGLYVCNCNGIREREVRAAIDAGARRPSDVFRARQCKPQCARCVCDIREMIDASHQALKFAAE
jgi:bacterioferritin-associated ferredoxin